LDGLTYQEVASTHNLSVTRVRYIAIRLLEMIAPDMNFTLDGIRKTRELLKKQIEKEL